MAREEIIRKRDSCRVCKGKSLSLVLSFGPTPLANAFLTKKQADKEELFYPLDVYFCNDCSFLQLGHVVSPVTLFSDYIYVSSTSKVFINHFKQFAKDVFKRFNLDSKSTVIDIGSNDGILLKPFCDLGVKVLGIEPAKHIAKVAQEEGIETIPEFFNVNIAQKIVKEKGKVKIITATNVFAHIDDLDEVIKGLKELLTEDGVFIMEAPYLIDFIQKRYFDLVYHEHLSYWAIKPLITIFKRFGMVVFDIQKVAAHGGTIRVFVKKEEGPHEIEKNVQLFLNLEKKAKLEEIETYLKFAKKVMENKIKLFSLLFSLKSKGKRIAAYGAPAKGNTLLNFFSIGKEFLDYVVDDSSWKQGLYTPGKRIAVVSSDRMYEDRTDYMLILAWNFSDSIMKIHQKYKELGGKFIIPVPIPKIA